MDLSDVDDEGSTQEQLSEFPDEAFGSGVLFTGEQWEVHEESFERDEDNVEFNDVEEVAGRR